MKKHYHLHGSPEWHANRGQSFNASDAPAMMSCSPYKTRSQLLHELHTGITPEVDAATQRRFDDGHRFEALCRPFAEEIIGEELAVFGGSIECEGLSRPLSASFDGMTFMDDVDWEAKTVNDDLRAALPHAGRDSHAYNDAKQLPKVYRVQLEQQLAISFAQKALFSAARFDEQGDVIEERHCWYYPDLQMRAEIIAGWRQFDVDLAAYTPPAPSAVEKLVAEPVEALPAPVIQITGQIALTDNFKVFEERLRQFLEERLIREPKSDQDFADLDQQIKAMKQARESLKAAGAQMLAQVQPVEQATKRQEMLDKLLQQNLSMAERLLKDEKERRRGEIVAGGISALKAHVDALNTRLGRPYMPAVPVDFGGVVKGLKSLASMEDKVASELARAKIDANQIADRIQMNLATLREKAADHVFLFPDTPQIVLKATDDLSTLVTARIAEHKEKEQKHLDAERERIRAEEAAKLQREQEEAERRRVAEEQARAAAQATPAPAAAPAPIPEAEAAVAAPHAVAPAPTVIPMPARPAATPTGKPTLSLGHIKERIAPIQITADGLATLGFTGLKDRGSGSVLFHEAEYPHILAALVAHVQAIQAKQAA